MKRDLSPIVAHTCGGPIFGRLASPGKCARCDALRTGAKPRTWSGSQRKADERRFLADLAAHRCTWPDGSRRCGPVCTFGDW